MSMEMAENLLLSCGRYVVNEHDDPPSLVRMTGGE